MATPPHIEPTAGGVTVRMQAPKAIPLVVFLSVWLTFWTFGGIAALRSIFTTGFSFLTLFLLVWIVGWFAGEVIAAWALVFLVGGGAEIVSVDNGALLRRAEAFGKGLTWRYPLDTVSNLRRVGGEDAESHTMLAFDTPAKTIRFGTNLSPDGAREIEAAFIAAAPGLAPR